ncbi:heme-binding domain-containing protein [Zunongwangia sp.]|uniref:heme-binding domain-containing protein n=1 Tax=Zunongwangia sp. TaxID=1965325 RepID=UPI003AA95C2B
MLSKNKILKNILICVLLVLVVLQFFKPTKNTSEEILNSDILKAEKLPRDISRILVRSCYDCHSNTTKYPWYSEITPVNYFLANHVNDGKKHLNFSEWAKLSSERKTHKVKEIGEEIENEKMPLNSYIWLHNDARITEEQKQLLLEWVKNYQPN